MPRMIDAFLMELEQEAVSTKRILESIPEDKLTWKPHEKSMSLGQLGFHIATNPGLMADIAVPDEFEFPEMETPQPSSKAEILTTLEEGLQHAKEILNGFDDQKLMATWKLMQKGSEIMAMPRVGVVRSFLLNHLYHHRGQLSVYLRLLDVPVPSVYGPTADVNPFAVSNE